MQGPSNDGVLMLSLSQCRKQKENKFGDWACGPAHEASNFKDSSFQSVVWGLGEYLQVHG